LAPIHANQVRALESTLTMTISVVSCRETTNTKSCQQARFDDRARHAGNSVFQSTLIFCNVIIAMGVLSMPFSFRKQGCLNFGIVAVAAVLLVRTSQLFYSATELATPIALLNNVAPRHQDWAFLAGLGCGHSGRVAVRVVLISSLTSYIVAFLSALGSLIHDVIPKCSVPFGIALSTGLAVALTRLPTKSLGRLSLLAHSSYFVAFACLVVTGWGNFAVKDRPSLAELFKQRAEEMQLDQSQISGIPTTFYLFVFSMAGTSVLPSVLSNMQKREQFSRVLCASYSIAVSVYFFVGLGGFVLFGGNTAQLFTANLGTNMWTGADLEGFKFLKPLASAMVICKLELCIPVLAYPVFADVKNMLEQQPATCSLVSGKRALLRHVWRAYLLAAMGLVAAMFGDKVAVLVSMVGALFGTPLICFMPVFVYVGISRRIGKRLHIMKCMELIAIVTLGCVLGCFAIADCWRQLNLEGTARLAGRHTLKPRL